MRSSGGCPIALWPAVPGLDINLVIMYYQYFYSVANGKHTNQRDFKLEQEEGLNSGCC